ncbi:DUF1176 domain-containing protein [Aquamicrobium ahrensii]|uniref:DUF1176 domain-containing protein n=1 Tax=Aquamicrobium ahrensii TaxID=469551 RepID=A0ABV2KJF9_9HYPH
MNRALARTVATVVSGCLVVAASTFAYADTDAVYIDDRSDPAALVRSLYSAINRHEYARAWDYFGETKPAADFESFAKGYEGTTSVEVATGGVSEEGAAGSIYYTIPVAIRAGQQDGGEKVFSGCYTLRQLSAQTQEPPFKPLHIEKGELKPDTSAFENALPASCGDGSMPPQRDTTREKAKAVFAASYGERCDASLSEDDETAGVADYTIRHHTRNDDAEKEARLFRFPCRRGAYNETFVFFLTDDDGGVRQLQFAEPELDIHYANDDIEGKLEAVNVVGYKAADELMNADYDEATYSIVAHSRWRGVGDASSTGTWLFRDGRFSLVQYEVDASYDGEINPQTVLDYNTAP